MGQKKSEQVLVMLVPEMFEEVKRIAAKEDRPLGYVARELMVRGLRLYQIDSKLKSETIIDAGADLADLELALSDNVLNAIRSKKIAGIITPGERTVTKADARRMLQKDAELLEDTKNTARKVPNEGRLGDGNVQKKRKTG